MQITLTEDDIRSAVTQYIKTTTNIEVDEENLIFIGALDVDRFKESKLDNFHVCVTI